MASRTKNAERNFLSAIFFQVINIVLKFALRTVFIYTLGKEYLGINGVFSNVLSILALSELGIGTAIIYDMYKPIAENNQDKIASLVTFFKQIYRFIGLFIFAAGLCILPFLDYILTDIPNVSHVTLIYLLYLISSTSSYFFAQYTSLISAYQKNHIITNSKIVFSVIKTVVETVLLIEFHSFILYLIIEIAVQVAQNYYIYLKAKVLFPFIRRKGTPLTLKEKKGIFKNALSNFSIRVSWALIDCTDNILISIFVSTILVGVYSNYTLIMQICLTSTVMIMNAVQAGVGNVCVGNNVKDKIILFKRINYLFVTIYAFVALFFVTSIDNFLKIWVGETYVLPFIVEIIIILNYCISGVRQATEIFVAADGLFKHFKYVPLVSAALNLILSVILGKLYGLIGILLATTISQLFTNAWYFPYIVCKYSLKESPLFYVRSYLRGVLFVLFTACLVKYLLLPIFNITNDYVAFVCSVFLSLVVGGVVYVVVTSKTEEFRYYKQLVFSLIKK